MCKERNETEMELKEFIAKNREAIREVCSDGLKRDSQGRVLLPKDDEWREEKEWEELYKELKRRNEG